MNRLLILPLIVSLTIQLAFLTRPAKAEEPLVQQASHEDSANEAAVKEFDLPYSPQWPTPPNTSAMLMRLVMGTVVVLGLCIGSLWLGKPWLMKLQPGQAHNQMMQVAGSVTLGNRAILYLVKVGDTQLIAGTDVTGLKSLLALPASFKDVLDEPEQSVDTTPVDSVQFAIATPTR